MQSCGGWRPVWGQFLTPQIPAWQLLWASVSPLQDSVRLRSNTHRIQNSACPRVSGVTMYQGGYYCLTLLFHTTWHCSQAKANPTLVFVNTGQCFQAKMFASTDNLFKDVLTILAEQNVINTFFSVCFQISKMCESAPQNIFNTKMVQIFWKFHLVKTASLKGR